MRLIFIAGAGKSGSTLLARILGTVPGFLHVGELARLWERGLRDNQLCGCGTPFRECLFWTGVLADVFGEGADLDECAEQVLRAWRRADSLTKATIMAFPKLGGRAALDYGDILRRVLQSIRRVSGADVIVDSSKRASHGLLLTRIDELTVDCLHLVRDSRGSCHSGARRRVRPEIHWDVAYMGVGRPWKQALRWDFRNALVSLVAARSHDSLRVRYEDFAAQPVEVATGILRDLELPGAVPPPARQAAANGSGAVSVVLPPEHSISGNPMRFESGEVAVKVDDEWRTAMPRRDRIAVTLLSAPLLAKYGYLGRE
jgi:hypothetical protein